MVHSVARPALRFSAVADLLDTFVGGTPGVAHRATFYDQDRNVVRVVEVPDDGAWYRLTADGAAYVTVETFLPADWDVDLYFSDVA
jgi:hypothetical protein